MAGFNLELADDDGVMVTVDRTEPEVPMICVKFPAYLLNATRKPVEPKETKPDSGIYTIPKTGTFVYAVKKFKAPQSADFADGAFRLSLTVGRKLSDTKRRAMLDDALGKKLRVLAADKDSILGETVAVPKSVGQSVGSKEERIA